MPVVIVVGVQWGDEGKGKIVDYLTERARLVVRFQGGNNAGHTLVVEGRKTALQLIPSGILRSSTRCLLAPGVVVDPFTFLEECARLGEIGVQVTPERLGIAGEVQLILPYHKAIDVEREERRGHSKIGTTGRGIGPAYEDLVARSGVRLIDLTNRDHLKSLVERNVAAKNDLLRGVLHSSTRFDAHEIVQKLLEIAPKLTPYISNVSAEVNRAIDVGEYVMFEGAQGCLLDIGHGTYPYVTSSNTVSSYACVSAGFSPRKVDLIVGISKAYCTRVGSGPFPTEDFGPEGERLRAVGREFGTVTGRPRRCGWFDVVAARRAVRLNGIDSMIITKLDVLSGFPKIKLGVAYRLDGRQIDEFPSSSLDADRIEPIYEEIDGWDENLDAVRSFDELPPTAQALLQRIEALTGCRIGGFSVGPDREQTIITDNRVRQFASI